MKKILLLSCIFICNSYFLHAQHLCFSYNVEIQKDEAVLTVFSKPGFQEGKVFVEPLASFSTKVFFNNDKINLLEVEYGKEIWEASFGEQMPKTKQGKSKNKSTSYIKLVATDLVLSTPAQIKKNQPIYTARFKSKYEGIKLKKKDIWMISAESEDSDIRYANYDGDYYPIKFCDVENREKNKEKEADLAIKGVYPNPSCDFFSLVFDPVNQEDVQLQIHNMTGQIVLQEKIEILQQSEITKELNISTLEAGLYFLVLTQDNERTTHKIVVNDCRKEGRKNNPAITKTVPKGID